MDIREKIRVCIREKGLTLGSVAERAGFSRAVFSNIVRGKRKIYADEVCQIAEALGVSIEYLFEQTNNAS